MIITKYCLSDIIKYWSGNNNIHNQLCRTWNDFIETLKHSKGIKITVKMSKTGYENLQNLKILQKTAALRPYFPFKILNKPQQNLANRSLTQLLHSLGRWLPESYKFDPAAPRPKHWLILWLYGKSSCSKSPNIHLITMQTTVLKCTFPPISPLIKSVSHI